MMSKFNNYLPFHNLANQFFVINQCVFIYNNHLNSITYPRIIS